MENTTIIARLLAVLCLILSGIIAINTANADSHLPDCKANPKCLHFEDLQAVVSWDEYKAMWHSLTAADMQAMIDAGADVNAKNKYGLTPLHWVVVAGNAEMISVLIKAGANVHAKNKYGLTPLHSAVKFRNAEVIPVLIKANAYIEAIDNKGCTPLQTAYAKKEWNTIKPLKDAGADDSQKDACAGAYDPESESSGSGLASPSCFNIIRSKPEQIVRVNGVRMTLLVDTGASITALSHQQAKTAGVQPTGQGEFTLANNSVVVNKTGSANISLGGRLTGNFPVSIGDGKGLLGRDVLDEFACQ